MREALRRKRALLPPSHPDIETSLVSLAGELQETGDYGAALEAISEAEGIVTKVFKPGDDGVDGLPRGPRLDVVGA